MLVALKLAFLVYSGKFCQLEWACEPKACKTGWVADCKNKQYLGGKPLTNTRVKKGIEIQKNKWLQWLFEWTDPKTSVPVPRGSWLAFIWGDTGLAEPDLALSSSGSTSSNQTALSFNGSADSKFKSTCIYQHVYSQLKTYQIIF